MKRSPPRLRPRWVKHSIYRMVGLESSCVTHVQNAGLERFSTCTLQRGTCRLRRLRVGRALDPQYLGMHVMPPRVGLKFVADPY